MLDRHSRVSVTGRTQIISAALRLVEGKRDDLYNGDTVARTKSYARGST